MLDMMPDINECKNSPCHSNGICINTPGSFHCYCPNGYYGDGSKNGAGCIRMPGSNSKVAIGNFRLHFFAC